MGSFHKLSIEVIYWRNICTEINVVQRWVGFTRSISSDFSVIIIYFILCKVWIRSVSPTRRCMSSSPHVEPLGFYHSQQQQYLSRWHWGWNIQLGSARAAADYVIWNYGKYSCVYGRFHGEAASKCHQLLPVVPSDHRFTCVGDRHAIQYCPSILW